MGTRDLQKEINELEKKKGIKLLDVTSMDGVFSRPLVESAIDSLKETLEQIDLSDIAKAVNEDLREFQERG